MSLLKRVFISISGNKGKHALFFLLVVGFGSFMSAVIIINQSIDQLSNGLWRQLPPLVVIDLDPGMIRESRQQETFTGEDIRILTPDVLQPIVELPYVREFDFFYGTVSYNRDLERVKISDFWDQMTLEDYPVMMMELMGVMNPSIMSIQTGMNQLVEGRTFTQNEINTENPHNSVVLISRSFADLNGLNLGSIITFENNFYKYHMIGYGSFIGVNLDENIVDYEIYSLEVVGIFEPILIPNFGDDWSEEISELHVNNSVYVPIPVVYSMMNFIETLAYEDALNHNLEAELFLAEEVPHRNIILLEDVAYLPAFIEGAESLLPSYYKVATFSDSVLAIERFYESLSFIQQISEQSILIILILTMIALGLVTLLFLRDRKNELGIYLALGEKKIKIAFQLFLESLLPTILGITLALFLGNWMANEIGRSLLVNEIITRQNFDLANYGWSNAGAQFQRFMAGQIDNLLEAYDLSFGKTIIFLFYGVSFTSVSIAILFPIRYIIKKSPREILTFNRGS